MRILLSSSAPFDGAFGGGQTYVWDLARTLEGRGHVVSIVGPEGTAGGSPPVERVALEGFFGEVVQVDCRSAGTVGQPWRNRNDALFRLLRPIVKRFKPDIVHANGIKSVLASLTSEAAIPFVATAHHPGVVCPIGTLLTPEGRVCHRPADPQWCVSCFCRQRSAGATIGRALGATPAWIYRRMGRALSKLRRPGFIARGLMYPLGVADTIEDRQVALAAAQRWIAPSNTILNALVRNGVEQSRIDHVPHGIVPLLRRRIEGLESRPVRFGYVGQTNHPKGLHVLLQAFSRLPNSLRCELHLVGGPQKPGESQYLDHWLRMCRERIVIRHGRVERARIAAAIQEFDVLVVPSICAEVFGLVVLEALSAGRPVVATDSGGPGESVRHGVDGLVVPANDVGALHAVLERLARDPAEVRRLEQGIAAVRTMSEHVAELERVYARVRLEVGPGRGV